MILSIRLLTAGHMQGMEIISIEDIRLFLYTLVPIDVFLCYNIGRNVKYSKFPMCFRISNQREENMQAKPYKKKKNQWIKFGREKSSKELPTKFEACMVSGGTYGFIMICM